MRERPPTKEKYRTLPIRSKRNSRLFSTNELIRVLPITLKNLVQDGGGKGGVRMKKGRSKSNPIKTTGCIDLRNSNNSPVYSALWPTSVENLPNRPWEGTTGERGGPKKKCIASAETKVRREIRREKRKRRSGR